MDGSVRASATPQPSAPHSPRSSPKPSASPSPSPSPSASPSPEPSPSPSQSPEPSPSPTPEPARVLRAVRTTLRVERVKGIEPSSPAWKAGALPLSYTRAGLHGSSARTVLSQDLAGEDLGPRHELLPGIALRQKARDVPDREASRLHLPEVLPRNRERDRRSGPGPRRIGRDHVGAGD